MKKFLDTLGSIETALSVVAMFLMALFVIADVVLREVFNTGMPWMNKTAVYLMSWAGYLGVIAVASRAAHLRPQFADKLWGKNPYLFVRVQNLVMLLFNIGMFVASLEYLKQSYEFGDMNIVLKVKLWVIQLIIPYCFFSIGLRNLYFIYNPEVQLSYVQEYES